MALSPIALFTYNRPVHTRRTVEALQRNSLSAQSDLFIFSDGAKVDDSSGKINELRAYLKTIRNFRSIQIVERSSNLGLSGNIIAGVQQVVSEFEKVIVLEDDLITSPFFLQFMNDGLDIYENDRSVISIHGYCYPVAARLPDSFFLRGADCWGWATWKRGWDLFEPDGRILLNKLLASDQIKTFDFEGSHPYLQMLKDQIAGKSNSWAIRWYASAFLLEKYTLYPGSSLIHNIGADGSGTHHGRETASKISFENASVKLFRIEIKQNTTAYNAFTDYFKKSGKRSLTNKIRSGITSILKSFH